MQMKFKHAFFSLRLSLVKCLVVSFAGSEDADIHVPVRFPLLARR
jgi:hypothetical protein